MTKPERELLQQRSAEGCYSWGESWKGETGLENDWINKAAAQGEPEAIYQLAFAASCINEDRAFGCRLYREAASLGNDRAQCHFALYYCPQGSVEQYQWLR